MERIEVLRWDFRSQDIDEGCSRGRNGRGGNSQSFLTAIVETWLKTLSPGGLQVNILYYTIKVWLSEGHLRKCALQR